MRTCLVLIACLAEVSGEARADVAATIDASEAEAAAAAAEAADADDLSVGAAVGAGGQGEATYGALELRLDAQWRGVRLGLGARGVWEDGVFRRADWARAADAVTLVRQLEMRFGGATEGAPAFALAAGALAPAQLARVATGHRASLDDRMRTGVRVALSTTPVDVGLEIDDLLDPSLVGGALAWQLASGWGVHGAAAVDPGAPGGVMSAIELGVTRRWHATAARVELGGSLVGEPGLGLAAVGFGSAALDRAGARWSATADLRAGTGTNGAAFGPLHRLERLDLRDRARNGFGAGLTVGVAAPAGWLALGARARPGLGPLATASAGVPMSRYLQGAAWLAVTPRAAAGAAELRIAWARRLFSSLQLARMYGTDEMTPAPRWSATVWFGAST